MHKRLILIACLILQPAASWAQDGHHSGVPKSPILLEGRAEKKHRSKHDYEFQRDVPQYDPGNFRSAEAATNALTAEDQELLIEWDKWRNRVSKKVWLKLNEQLTGGLCFNLGGILISTGEGSGYRFRKGIEVSYMCEITRDRRITNLRVTHPSGDPTYDNLVLACVRALDGKKYLEFPEGSRRTRVKTAATLRIGRAQFHETKYNDNEFVKLSDSTD